MAFIRCGAGEEFKPFYYGDNNSGFLQSGVQVTCQGSQYDGPGVVLNGKATAINISVSPSGSSVTEVRLVNGSITFTHVNGTDLGNISNPEQVLSYQTNGTNVITITATF